MLAERSIVGVSPPPDSIGIAKVHARYASFAGRILCSHGVTMRFSVSRAYAKKSERIAMPRGLGIPAEVVARRAEHTHRKEE